MCIERKRHTDRELCVSSLVLSPTSFSGSSVSVARRPSDSLSRQDIVNKVFFTNITFASLTTLNCYNLTLKSALIRNAGKSDWTKTAELRQLLLTFLLNQTHLKLACYFINELE